MQKKSHHRSSWKWFGVKVLYESIITGKANPSRIDKDFDDTIKTFEESIIIIKALSFEQAWKKAQPFIRENEIEYKNPYGQNVRWQFVKIVDTYHLFDDELHTGTEVYSRYISLPRRTTKKKMMQQLYPDSV